MHSFMEFNSLNSYLHYIDWDIVLDPEDGETAWKSFSSTLTAAVSDHSRHRQIKAVLTKPWLSENILSMVRRKKKSLAAILTSEICTQLRESSSVPQSALCNYRKCEKWIRGKPGYF
ncbi:hypothetical protein HHI36_009195 [Cryptolaemus montrouzieri]|uniref:Uncharacterized protein n=1 Tax=Cryptolaemus montrouzieri TaxID=559131 RepID=A0ABD2MV03_9CUCU